MQLSQGSLRALLQAHSHLPRAEVSWQEWSPGKLLGRVEQNRVLVGVFRRLLMGNRELTKERFELDLAQSVESPGGSSQADLVPTTAHTSPSCFCKTWGVPLPDRDLKGGLDIKD